MKRILLVIITLCALLLLSCNEDYKLFPDKYNRILSLKNSGVRELRSGNTVKEYKDSILVLKGGGNPDNDAFARIEVMELGKACETFGYEGGSIEIIASESYSISGGDDIVLEGSTRSRYIPITFSPENIYRQALKAKGKTLVLPVVLRSETDTVNTSSSTILWKFDINGPKVVWPDRSDICEEISLREMDCDIEAKVEYSESNLSPFVGKIVKEGLEALVDEYNSKNSTSYKLLPESSWSFDGVDGINVEAKKEIVKGRLHLSREGLNSDETYLLPLKFDAASFPVGVSEEVRYLVVTNPKYVYRPVDRTDWKLLYVNSQEHWYGATLDLQWFATYAFDGRPETTWGTQWNGDSSNPSWDDYIYTPGGTDLHLNSIVPTLFLGYREVPNIIMVIDLGREYNLGGAGILQSTKENERKVKRCEVYAESAFVFNTVQEGGSIANYNTLDEGNNWKLFTTIETDWPLKEYWSHVQTAVKGRYVKIRPIELFHHDPKAVNIAEFYVSELVSIDGYPVK